MAEEFSDIDATDCAKYSMASIWLTNKDDETNDNRVRSNTFPLIASTNTNLATEPAVQVRNMPSLSLPDNTVRKSFFGELKNLLTFKKKEDQIVQDNKDSDLNNLNEQELGKKANPHQQIARRKPIFENQADKEKVEENLAKVSNKINTLQMSIKKWKNKKNTELTQERDSIAMNVYHQKLLDDSVERLQTEVPYPLHIVIKEEALLIATKTHLMYKSMLGSKHKLTKEAESHIAYLTQTTYRSESY